MTFQANCMWISTPLPFYFMQFLKKGSQNLSLQAGVPFIYEWLYQEPAKINISRCFVELEVLLGGVVERPLLWKAVPSRLLIN